jgi:protein TonB
MHPPKPLGHPGEWASDLDYPKNALRIGATGYVLFQLSVAANGKPTACEVVSSSKNADLDKTACDLVMARARFSPATDEDGKPVAGLFRSTIRWQIPEGNPPMPAPSRLSVAYDVLPNGSVVNCSVTVTGVMLTKIPDNPQSLCAGRGPFARSLDAQGKPIKKHVVEELSVVIEDVP